MADLAVTNTFVAATRAKAGEVNTNFSDVVSYINARNSGTAWDSLAVTGNGTIGGTLGVTGASTFGGTLGITGVSTFTGGVASLLGYRRPNLTYVSATTVDVENNTGTANQTTIVFPDGTVRSVTEDTASTHKYRRFLITATAEFLTGTEDSGLYTGLAEATNTWYAVYAVKSVVSAANFVLVGTTTLPLQANFATLNTNLGTNGWVYLGLIRNGDNAGATGDICKFFQSNGTTLFANAVSNNSPQTIAGIKLAAVTGNTTLSFAITRGTGTTDIPLMIKMGYVSYSFSAAPGGIDISVNGIRRFYGTLATTGVNQFHLMQIDTTFDVTVTNSINLGITFSGFMDSILSVGTNPVL